MITFQAMMSQEELTQLCSVAKKNSLEAIALQVGLGKKRSSIQSHSSHQKPEVLGFCCLLFCIWLTTRFKDLTTFGFKSFLAFSIGVLLNIPLVYFLTTVVFQTYWRYIYG